MGSFLGIDTSNYTTSVAIYFLNGNVKQYKKLLPVKKGERGLRQNDAVFNHVKIFPELFNKIKEELTSLPIAVGVSSKPRDEFGSYMPCFVAGTSFAKVISQILNVPCYEFSHQDGHIVAALYSAKRLDLLRQKFLTFHVSGGTTEVLLVSPCKEKIMKKQIVAKTLDINAGQLIDRIGVMLGKNFPAGAELENLAKKCDNEFKIRASLKNFDCCLSGAENLCKKMKEDNKNDELIAKFCIDYVATTIEKMCDKLLDKFGEIPLLFAGGVMSNSIIKNRLKKRFNPIFAEPTFSSDNAVGVAVLAAIKAGGYNEC